MSAQVGDRTVPWRWRMIAARRWSSLAGRWALALAVIAAGLWVSTNGVADVTWREVAVVVSRVTVLHLVWLTLIWLAGLATYASVLGLLAVTVASPSSLPADMVMATGCQRAYTFFPLSATLIRASGDGGGPPVTWPSVAL